MNAIRLAERMHWTLDYIYGMETAQFYRVLTALGAIDSAQSFAQRQRR